MPELPIQSDEEGARLPRDANVDARRDNLGGTGGGDEVPSLDGEESICCTTAGDDGRAVNFGGDAVLAQFERERSELVFRELPVLVAEGAISISSKN